MIRTLIPRRKDAYAAFPTFVTWGAQVCLFYRKGITATATPHGKAGAVYCRIFDKSAFLAAFEPGNKNRIFPVGEESVIFSEGNEMDSIVSNPTPGCFALATRNYDSNKKMRTYLSLEKEPHFPRRNLVQLNELEWLAFFGKSMFFEGRYIFTAYGSLHGESFGRPLVLACNDRMDWELLAALPSWWDHQTILNESTLVRIGDLFHLVMRQDMPPFGLWHATSPNLRVWSQPEPLCQKAQAPMAISLNNRLLISYRLILDEDRATTALWLPFEKREPLQLDPYQGNIYDGGYSDIGLIDGNLFVIYYHGNPQREPFIKARLISPDLLD